MALATLQPVGRFGGHEGSPKVLRGQGLLASRPGLGMPRAARPPRGKHAQSGLFRRGQAQGPGRAPARPVADPDPSAGWRLGRAGRAAADVLLLQRLSRPVAPSGREGGGLRGRGNLWRGRWRLAPGHRRPPVDLGAGGAPGAASRGPRLPASSDRAIWPMPASCRPWSGSGDLLLVDELAHACIWAGANLSGAVVLSFRHNDMDHLAALLAEYRGGPDRALVATDTVFSMDGDLAPLARYRRCRRAHDAWLMTDDAHGLGVWSRAAASCRRRPKSRCRWARSPRRSGAYGGYLCASRAVIDLMINRARTLIYSTGLPPGRRRRGHRRAGHYRGAIQIYALCPLVKARRFTQAAGLAFGAKPHRAVGPRRGAGRAGRLAAAGATRGSWSRAIRPPTVPEGTARLRFAFAAGHPDAEVDRLGGRRS